MFSFTEVTIEAACALALPSGLSAGKAVLSAAVLETFYVKFHQNRRSRLGCTVELPHTHIHTHTRTHNTDILSPFLHIYSRFHE